MTESKTTLPEWCLTKTSNELRAMAAQEYPFSAPRLLGVDITWGELIAMAERREKRDPAAAQRNAHGI